MNGKSGVTQLVFLWKRQWVVPDAFEHLDPRFGHGIRGTDKRNTIDNDWQGLHSQEGESKGKRKPVGIAISLTLLVEQNHADSLGNQERNQEKCCFYASLGLAVHRDAAVRLQYWFISYLYYLLPGLFLRYKFPRARLIYWDYCGVVARTLT